MTNREGAAKQPARRAKAKRGKTGTQLGSVLPASGEGDSNQAWGDQWSNDERLRAEVPPHFGKI